MRFSQLLDDVADLDDHEKLEWLVEMADELPTPSYGLVGGQPAEHCRVQECQTPVYLWVNVRNGRVQVEADVPKQSPTVRGLMAVLVQGIAEASAAEVLGMPDDVVSFLGLQRALGMQRQQGFRGVVARIKREVRRQADAAN